jgi:hypothetical protein
MGNQLYVPDLSASVASSYKSQSRRSFDRKREDNFGNPSVKSLLTEVRNGGRLAGLETLVYLRGNPTSAA